MLRIHSPAKINFVLELLGKREDGFHNISSIMAPVSLFDEITIVRSKVNTVNFNSNYDGTFEDATIQIKTICDLLATRSTRSFPVTININKLDFHFNCKTSRPYINVGDNVIYLFYCKI